MATKLCSYCAEEIQEQARKCKHCGEYLDDELRSKHDPAKKTEDNAFCMNCGTQLPATSLQCDACGSSTTETEFRPPAPTALAPPPPHDVQSRWYEQGYLIGISLIIIAALLFLFSHC